MKSGSRPLAACRAPGVRTGAPPRPSLAAATGRTRGTTMFAPRTQFMHSPPPL